MREEILYNKVPYMIKVGVLFRAPGRRQCGGTPKHPAAVFIVGRHEEYNQQYKPTSPTHTHNNTDTHTRARVEDWENVCKTNKLNYMPSCNTRIAVFIISSNFPSTQLVLVFKTVLSWYPKFIYCVSCRPERVTSVRHRHVMILLHGRHH